MADHFINLRIVLWDVGQCQIKTIMFLCKIKRFADTGEHPKCKHIYLQKTKCFDVVLVPLDICPVLHSRIEQWTQIRNLSFRDNESSGMLSELPGKTDVLRC